MHAKKICTGFQVNPYKNNFSCIFLKKLRFLLNRMANTSFLQAVSILWTWFNDGFGVPRIPEGLGDVCAPGYPGVAKYPSNDRDPVVRWAAEVLENPGLLWLP